MSFSVTVGQQIRLATTVKDASGTVVDAGSVTISVKTPQGAVTSLTPLHDTLGQYHADYEPATAGEYYARIVTLNPDSAVEGSFYVMPSPFF